MTTGVNQSGVNYCNMKKIIISVLLLSLAIGWMFFIFSMSAEPAEMSTETSGNTIRKIFELVYPGFKNMEEADQIRIIDESQFFVRKAAHFSMYAVLGILLTVNVSYHIKNRRLILLLPLLIGILYSVSDEIHQTFVPGRSGQISDVILDSFGVLFGCAIIVIIVSRIHNKTNSKE